MHFKRKIWPPEQIQQAFYGAGGGAELASTIPFQDFLLMETGDFLLLETGDKIMLEQQGI